MAKYRKIPVVIEAVQWTGDNRDEINDLIGVASTPGGSIHAYSDDGMLLIKTLESQHGMHTASKGDFIIKGVKGEFYPCKPDIFAMTYQLVSENDTMAYEPFIVPYKDYVIRKLDEDCLVAFQKDDVGFYLNIPRDQKLKDAVKEMEDLIDGGIEAAKGGVTS